MPLNHNPPVSRARRFGRSLFSSQPKADSISELKSAQKPIQAPPESHPGTESPQVPERTPEPPPNVSRRQSKASLFDLFSKPKVERARGHHEPGIGLETVPERSQTPAQFYGKSDKKPEPTVPSRATSRLTVVPQNVPSQRSPTKVTREFDTWDPPPLFQAFPQAVKHGKQQGVNMSTDTLLRAQSYKRNNGLEGYRSTTSLPFVQEGQEQTTDPSKLKRFSVLADAPEIVSKVFVLVTAGRLMQYAGHGHSDRMPEKVLQLGSKSAAFACDLIPGKHWVVQVVHSATEDGLPAIKQSRSLLSRLRVPTANNRRMTTTFLMIFDSPEEMDSWLKAIRGVIEKLGGKQRSKADPEIRREREQEVIAQKRLSQVPTHRFMVQRDPQRFDDRRDSTSPVANATKLSGSPPEQKRLSILSSTTSTPAESQATTPIEKEPNVSRTRRISWTASSSVNSTQTSLSPDLLRLEPLKESARFSSASTRTSHTFDGEAVTAATSVCSSSPPSPLKPTVTEPEAPKYQPALKSLAGLSNGDLGSRRRSTQTGPPLSALPATPPGARSRKSMSVIPSDRLQRLPRQFSPEMPPRRSSLKLSTVPVNPHELPQRRQPLGPPPVLEDVPESPLTSSSSFSPVQTTHPASKAGQLPNTSNHSPKKVETTPNVNPRRPLFRPIPIRPTNPNSQSQSLPRTRPQSQIQSNRTAQSALLPRRLSSLPLPPPAEHLPARPPAFTPSLAIRDSSRSTFTPTPTASSTTIASGRRTPSVASINLSGIASPSGNTTTTTSSPQSSVQHTASSSVSSQSASQVQSAKLRRPTSVQIRADHAPFLSSRNRVSVSWQSSQRTVDMRSTSAPSASIQKHITSAIALSAGGAAMGIAAPVAVATQLASNEPPLSTETRPTASSPPLTASSRSASQLSLYPTPSLLKPSSRAPTPSRAAFRYTMATPTATFKTTTSDLVASDGPVKSNAPPVPPMNPNRPGVLRAKNSMPNVTLATLPPPMPPPSCPLPQVPAEHLVGV